MERHFHWPAISTRFISTECLFSSFLCGSLFFSRVNRTRPFSGQWNKKRISFFVFMFSLMSLHSGTVKKSVSFFFNGFQFFLKKKKETEWSWDPGRHFVLCFVFIFFIFFLVLFVPLETNRKAPPNWSAPDFFFFLPSFTESFYLVLLFVCFFFGFPRLRTCDGWDLFRSKPSKPE